jgi:hypothetical protein
VSGHSVNGRFFVAEGKIIDSGQWIIDNYFVLLQSHYEESRDSLARGHAGGRLLGRAATPADAG